MFVDYAGQTVPAGEPRDWGAARGAGVRRGAWGVELHLRRGDVTSRCSDWTASHVRGECFGGAGNPKSRMIRSTICAGRRVTVAAHRYERTRQPTYHDGRRHTTRAWRCVPRAGTKLARATIAKVEVAVQVVTALDRPTLNAIGDVLLPGRRQRRGPSSLSGFNRARRSRKLPGSRRCCSRSLDRPALRPLPSPALPGHSPNPEEVSEWTEHRVDSPRRGRCGHFSPLPYCR